MNTHNTEIIMKKIARTIDKNSTKIKCDRGITEIRINSSMYYKIITELAEFLENLNLK